MLVPLTRTTLNSFPFQLGAWPPRIDQLRPRGRICRRLHDTSRRFVHRVVEDNEIRKGPGEPRCDWRFNHIWQYLNPLGQLPDVLCHHHLFFEVRFFHVSHDGSVDPLQPLLHGLAAYDRRPPW